MKIAFLTSGVEPGFDGVGDYTRSLALECIRLGHFSKIYALKDRYIDSIESFRREADEQSEVTSCRYNNAFKGNHQKKIGEEIEDWNPDWISLQFVGYGFQSKGIVFGLSDQLATIINGRKLHIMLHEIWIGDSIEYGWKDRTIGYLQKLSIINLIKKVQPRVIHTSNPTFQNLLRRNGISAGELPLFGNISVVSNHGYEDVYNLFNSLGLIISSDTRNDYLLAGFFGTIHHGWNLHLVYGRLREIGKKLGKIPVIISVGKMGARGKELWKYSCERYGTHLKFIEIGEQSSEVISMILQIMDFGITTTPLALADKSGTVSAMVEHGLPIVFLRDDWALRIGPTPSPNENVLYHKLDSEFTKEISNGLERGNLQSGCGRIAKQFIAELSN